LDRLDPSVATLQPGMGSAGLSRFFIIFEIIFHSGHM
jgi:hypothetical protein